MLTLLSKSAGGGRWKRAVSGSHQLLWSGLACMILLCAIAAVSNIMVPIRQLESIRALADWPTALAYGLLAIVLAWLWRSGEARGQKVAHKRPGLAITGLANYADLVALLLGMLAPLAAIFYANWLAAVPARYAVEAKQFEPYRAQVVTWLVVLGMGLIVRFTQHRRNVGLSAVKFCGCR